jgi:hypothetical protein
VTSESDKFLRKLEIENNGPILWKTYAFLLAREGRGTESLGGLLYIVGGSRGNTAENRLIFEDFESERPYFLVLGARRKAYKKTKLQAPLNSIISFKALTRGDAQRIVGGKISLDEVKPPSGLRKLLDRTVYALSFTEREPWFCELFDPSGLENYLKE